MLDDGDAGPEQRRVDRPRPVADVVDVERIDPDQRRTRLGEPLGGLGGEERVAREVVLGAPVPSQPVLTSTARPATSIPSNARGEIARPSPIGARTTTASSSASDFKASPARSSPSA